MPNPTNPKIAVIIPCYNEALTIGGMIQELQQVLPEAQIVICDNNSTDETFKVASAHGAVVLKESRQGKGYAMQRLFSCVDADIYVLMDGDATYDIASAPKLIQKLREERLGMVVGSRIAQHESAYRMGHQWGNRLITGMLGFLFEAHFEDILSGYRVFTKAFVKSFPINTGGFTIESAMTVHALQLRVPCAEVATPYYSRPSGSHSKLNTWRDGFRISTYIGQLFISERPLVFYGLLGAICAIISLIMFTPVFFTYLNTGLVPRMPTLMVVGSLALSALVCLIAGLILQAVSNARRETKQLAYLGN